MEDSTAQPPPPPEPPQSYGSVQRVQRERAEAAAPDPGGHALARKQRRAHSEHAKARTTLHTLETALPRLQLLQQEANEALARVRASVELMMARADNTPSAVRQCKLNLQRCTDVLGAEQRALDAVIAAVQAFVPVVQNNEVYLLQLLDAHVIRMQRQRQLDFWRDASTRVAHCQLPSDDPFC